MTLAAPPAIRPGPTPSGVPAGRHLSAYTVLLLAVGSAVGLGDVWRLPWLAEQHGGLVFVLAYLAALAAVGVPVLMAEFMIGRRTRRDPVGAYRGLACRGAHTTAWQAPGWFGIGGGLLVLACYTVVGGWVLAYLWEAARGGFEGITSVDAGRRYAALLADPLTLVAWQTLFIGVTTAIVARGVRSIGCTARVLVPALGLLLAGLAVHAVAATPAGTGALAALLQIDRAHITIGTATAALSHAAFTLGVGTGAMIVCGAWLPREVSIPRVALTVAAADAGVTLLAATAVMPLVVMQGLGPTDGPELVFVTLPAAFGALATPWAGAMFFLALTLAAVTTGVMVLEPAVMLAQARLRLSRPAAALGAGAAAWTLGAAAALAFSRPDGVRMAGMGLFDLLGWTASGLLVPLAALGAALFTGWVVTRRTTREELGLTGGRYMTWRGLIRWAVPLTAAGAMLL